MSNRRIFALHPDWVMSCHDLQWHYIDIGQLAVLYQLRPTEFIVWRDGRGYDENNYIHLHPRYDGRYGRPVHVESGRHY